MKLSTLTGSLLGLYACDNLLLLHFWGLSLPVTGVLILLAAAAVSRLCARISDDLPMVPFGTVATAFAISVALFALGGEGGFFYANTDWQIRDAVMRDMATNPWPYAYDIGGVAYFLRAPLGAYLVPAMFGANAALALLISNALRLTLLLTLGSYLFEDRRQRAIGLLVFILFSGWDLPGTAIYSAFGAHPSWDHIEAWNFGYQYSSNVTVAFWAPQHALAGWTCAVAFLLWRKGLVPLGIFAASMVLTAIWSPLALLGAVPFALLAGFSALRRHRFGLTDICLTALAVTVALPALIYLQVDAASVGAHLRSTNPIVWLFCVALEVLPFTLPLLWGRASSTIDRPTVWFILVLLLAMPLIQIGISSDFQMRSSIMPLALLAIYFGQWLCKLLEQKPAPRAAIAYAVVAVAMGAATPLLELKRAVVNPPSPKPLCSLTGVWNKQDNIVAPYSTYLAPVSMLPSGLRQLPVTAGKSDPAQCWDRKWVIPARG